MAVEIQLIKDCCFIMAKGHMDAEDCHIIEEAEKFIELSKNKYIVVDCEKVTSITQEALQRLSKLSCKADANGINLVLLRFNPSITEDIKGTGTNKVLLTGSLLLQKPKL